MSKAVGIIPARWSSTRFPGKPLHLIANKPLLRHVWERCQRSKKLDAVIIATDDMRIAEAAFDWGAEVAMTSPNIKAGPNPALRAPPEPKKLISLIIIKATKRFLSPPCSIASWAS